MDNTPCKYNELKMGDVFMTYVKDAECKMDKRICRVSRVTPLGKVYAYSFTKEEAFYIGKDYYNKCIDIKNTEAEFRLTKTQFYYNRIMNYDYRDDDILFIFSNTCVYPIHVLHAKYAEIE